MSIATLADFKLYMRELTADLDATFQLALDSATAEVNAYLGMDAETDFGSEGIPSDVVMACMLLAQVHADMGDPEGNDHRRVAAQRLLTPYRLNTGFGATEVAA